MDKVLKYSKLEYKLLLKNMRYVYYYVPNGDKSPPF